VRGSDSAVGPYSETPYVLTASEDDILGQGVALVSSSVSLPQLCVIHLLQNSVVSKLEPKL
jgi:hypothetical protein